MTVYAVELLPDKESIVGHSRCNGRRTSRYSTKVDPYVISPVEDDGTRTTLISALETEFLQSYSSKSSLFPLPSSKDRDTWHMVKKGANLSNRVSEGYCWFYI